MITPDRPRPSPSPHPSFPAREGVQMRQRSATVTCSACQITYLHPPPAAALALAGTWVCARCTTDTD